MPDTSWSREWVRERRIVAFFVVAVLFLAATLVPTPYFLISPGSAVDLGAHVTVEGHAPPRRRFFLTDVAVRPATVALLAGALLPGTRLERHDAIVPPGQTLRGYDRVLTAAMDESRRLGAYVAERAAGYPLAPVVRHVVLVAFASDSAARPDLRAGDELVRVGDRAIAAPRDVKAALRRVTPGARVRVGVLRAGRALGVDVRTIATPAGARFGVGLGSETVTPELAVPVHYALDDVEGSSGGLMFALTVYAELRDLPAGPAVAGTGTIDADGNVGPIAGTVQKLIAARRAGASLFLVPVENYPEIASERGIAIVPVRTFAQALAAVERFRPAAPAR